MALGFGIAVVIIDMFKTDIPKNFINQCFIQFLSSFLINFLKIPHHVKYYITAIQDMQYLFQLLFFYDFSYIVCRSKQKLRVK